MKVYEGKKRDSIVRVKGVRSKRIIKNQNWNLIGSKNTPPSILISRVGPKKFPGHTTLSTTESYSANSEQGKYFGSLCLGSRATPWSLTLKTQRHEKQCPACPVTRTSDDKGPWSPL